MGEDRTKKMHKNPCKIVYLFMSNSCRNDLKSLVKCMKSSHCMSIENKSYIECGSDQKVIEQCNDYRQRYLVCKRSQLDMRNRFRGNKSNR